MKKRNVKVVIQKEGTYNVNGKIQFLKKGDIVVFF